jgi:hypothetical protein
MKPWIWRRHVPSKPWYLPTRLCGVTAKIPEAPLWNAKKLHGPNIIYRTVSSGNYSVHMEGLNIASLLRENCKRCDEFGSYYCSCLQKLYLHVKWSEENHELFLTIWKWMVVTQPRALPGLERCNVQYCLYASRHPTTMPSKFSSSAFHLPITVAAQSKHELSLLARTLGSWVRIPLKAWMSVYVYSVFVSLCVYV